MNKIRIYNRLFLFIIAAAFLFILLSNPFLRIPYDPVRHLISIVSLHDDGECFGFWPEDKGTRCFWYRIWAGIFKLSRINDFFIWAKIIHVSQFILSAVILYYFSKIVLTILIKSPSHHLLQSGTSEGFTTSGNANNNVNELRTIQIKFLSLFSVFLWFVGNGTFSMEYQQAWIMWYSVTYQGLSIPLFWWSTALTLKLFYEESTYKKKIFFIVQLLMAAFIIVKIHGTEFLYYLINLSILLFLNLKGILRMPKRKFLFIAFIISTIVVISFILIRYFLPEYGSLLNRFSKIGNLGQILEQIRILGHEIVPGLNRFPNSFSEIALISLIAMVIFRVNYLFTKKEDIPFNRTFFDYLLISSLLFFLIPVISLLAGAAGLLTRPDIVWRFFFASPWFILLPFIVYVIIRSENIHKVLTGNPIYRLLIKNEQIIIPSGKIVFSIITITVIVLLIVVPNRISLKHIVGETLSFRTTILNVKSIMNSLDEKKVGVQYSKDYIEAIGQAIKKCEQSNKGKPNIYFTNGPSIIGGVGDKAYIIRGVYRKYVLGDRRSQFPNELFFQWGLDTKYNLIDIDHPEKCSDGKE